MQIRSRALVRSADPLRQALVDRAVRPLRPHRVRAPHPLRKEVRGGGEEGYSMLQYHRASASQGNVRKGGMFFVETLLEIGYASRFIQNSLHFGLVMNSQVP